MSNNRQPRNDLQLLTIIFFLKIYTCITEGLIPSLSASPPDVESLRVYLSLPMYHGFTEPERYSTLHAPFAKAVLQLTPKPQEIVGLWWRRAPVQLFLRLIRTYKSVVLHLIKESKIRENQASPPFIDNK